MRQLIVLVTALALGCEKKPAPGYLYVLASNAGTFEIYRTEDEASLQYVSEDIGYFNQALPLAAGSYLVLADCSSIPIIIYPNVRERLTVHRVIFNPPHEPTEIDNFTVQCSRSHKTKSRQNIENRFDLNVLHGKRDLLVGMVPMSIDFTKMPDPNQPKELSYNLSALQVADYDEYDQTSSYFVSPRDQMLSITKSQYFGKWEFLLPGPYRLEVNGTKTDIDLLESERRTVAPGFIRVSTSDEVDLSLSSKIKGSPQLVEINLGHWLNFNQTYAVLPGTATLRVSGSSHAKDVQVSANQTVNVSARTATIDLQCSPWDFTCLGGKEISLYLAEEPYPFTESYSDIPITYFASDEPVWIGIEGSQDIRYRLPQNKRDTNLRVGYVELVPEPVYMATQVTDLVRMEAIKLPYAGHTLDIRLDRPSSFPLIAGWYHLAHFVSSTLVEGDRRKSKRGVHIRAGETTRMKFKVYFSEKRLARYQKKRKDAEEAKRQRAFNSSDNGRSAPLGYL